MEFKKIIPILLLFVLMVFNAKAQGLSNMHFVCGDINNTIPSDEKFDIIFFHASLHHFYDIDTFIKGTVIPRLKPNGHIVINEYVEMRRLGFLRCFSAKKRPEKAKIG